MYRILVVDDEPMIRKGIAKLINQSAPGVVSTDIAENGVEALQKIAQHRPDFLFVDIRMPRMDGVELCQKVQELYQDIAIVVISGYSDFEYAQKCMSYGVKEYILKPVTRTGIAETIRKLLTQAATEQAKAFIPLSVQEMWLAQLDGAIWHLNREQLQETIDQINQYTAKQSMSVTQLRSMLFELHLQLVKTLNQRDVYVFNEFTEPTAALPNHEQIFAWFLKASEGLLKLLKDKRRGNTKDPVEEVKLYIERNLSKELSLEEVADMLGLNPSYFSQLFKQMTNETFSHYRIKRRMEKAKKLLALPQYKITDISHEVGYADHPHFTKTFKKNTGYTPSEYRGMLGID
jgi:two-component system response regulator YesN